MLFRRDFDHESSYFCPTRWERCCDGCPEKCPCRRFAPAASGDPIAGGSGQHPHDAQLQGSVQSSHRHERLGICANGEVRLGHKRHRISSLCLLRNSRHSLESWLSDHLRALRERPAAVHFGSSRPGDRLPVVSTLRGPGTIYRWHSISHQDVVEKIEVRNTNAESRQIALGFDLRAAVTRKTSAWFVNLPGEGDNRIAWNAAQGRLTWTAQQSPAASAQGIHPPAHRLAGGNVLQYELTLAPGERRRRGSAA